MFGVISLVAVGILGGSIAYDGVTISRAKPPASIQTLDDFLTWQQGAVTGSGTLESGGVTYTVILGPRVRLLASGPSAYLFDTNRQFFDWTSDMGDAYTAKHRLNLSSVRIKTIQRGEPS
jgi:hypothetical protein